MEAPDVAWMGPLVLAEDIQRRLKGLWLDVLRGNPQVKDGQDQPIQLWVSLWDSRILEERKKRLGDLEGEEEQDVESDSRENEIVSKLQVLEKEDEPDAQDKIVATLNIDSNARLEEHTSFVSDDKFVKSKEFKSFLYHFKGNKLRDAMPNVTPENEAKMFRKLKAEIDSELENMNPERGRQLLVENSERRTSNGEITSNWNNSNRSNNVSNNRGNNGNNENNGNNGSGNGNNRANNGNVNNENGNNNNQNGGGGKNGNNGNNRGNGNFQNNNYGCRPPMTIERYKHLDFKGMVGYPNQISSDLRSAIPKFKSNGTDSTEQHVINVKNTIEEFEVPNEDDL
ncbi:uncharacterized protein LOC131875980 [Cryptomeria japonica]|uniref:uncharacterized protein LOC131875980 n=1 Tax=Cryptomeria japonica TaxID=3369 RepID=UPI0027DA4A66|nr:uncharacterized protein LOC131875980 [Cryptomeria japonica]